MEQVTQAHHECSNFQIPNPLHYGNDGHFKVHEEMHRWNGFMNLVIHKTSDAVEVVGWLSYLNKTSRVPSEHGCITIEHGNCLVWSIFHQ